MQTGVLGISYKTASIEVREILSRTTHKAFESKLRNLDASLVSSFIILNTCNRTEIYFYSEDLAEAHSRILCLLRDMIKEEFEPYLYSYFGFDCFLHLAKVVCGLDSAITAETEIQGQVRRAYEQARLSHNLDHALHYIFQKGLMIGKKTRSLFALEKNKPSFERAFWLEMERNVQENASILFIGASQVNLNILRYGSFRKVPFQIYLANRTESLGKQAIDSLDNVQWKSWTEVQNWDAFDSVVVGTSSVGYLIHEKPKVRATKLLMDLSLPRNIDPKLAACKGLKLMNIDYLQQKVNHNALIHQAEAHKVMRFIHEDIIQKYWRFENKAKKVPLCHALQASIS